MTAAYLIVIAGILTAILVASAMAFICDWPRPKLKYGHIKVGCSIKVYEK